MSSKQFILNSIVSAFVFLFVIAFTFLFAIAGSYAGSGAAITTVFGAVTTAPGQNKLLCFDGTTDPWGFGGICTLNANGAKGPATLNNSSTNPNGDYSGVYILNSNLNGVTLSSVKHLGYSYTGTISPLPGNLSLNIPIDSTGNGATDGYAFIDAYYCPGTDGRVDIIHDAVCGIWYLGVQYANWAAFVAAYPTATITNDYAFIVAERTPSEPTAVWTVNNVTLGKPGAAN